MLRFYCPSLSNIDLQDNTVFYATKKGICSINLETYKSEIDFWELNCSVNLAVRDNIKAISLKKSAIVLENGKDKNLRIACTKLKWNNNVLSGVGRNFWMYDYVSDAMTTVRTLSHQATNLAFNNDTLAISTVKGLIIYDVRQISKPIFETHLFGIQDISWQKDNLIVGSIDKIISLGNTFEQEFEIATDCYKIIDHEDYILNVPLYDRSSIQIYQKQNFINEFFPTDDYIVDAKFDPESNSVISLTDNQYIEVSKIPQTIQMSLNTNTTLRPKLELVGYPTSVAEEVFNCTNAIKDMHAIHLDFSSNIFLFEVTAGNSFLVTIKIRLPKGYPKSAPIQPYVESSKFGDLQSDLCSIGKSFYIKGKRCMRDLLEYVRQYPSRRLTNKEENVVVEDKLEETRESENVPFPCLCGVAFSPRGMAVFFSPIYLEKPTDKPGSAFVFRIGLQNHPRSYEMYKQFKTVAFKYLKEVPKYLSPIGGNPTISITLIDDIPGLLPSTLLSRLDFNTENFDDFLTQNSEIVKSLQNPMSYFIWISFQSAAKLIDAHFCQKALFGLLQQSVYRIIQQDDILLASLLAGGISLLRKQIKRKVDVPKVDSSLIVFNMLNYMKSLPVAEFIDIPGSNGVDKLLQIINPLVQRFIQLLQKFEMHRKKMEFLKILGIRSEGINEISSNYFCYNCNNKSETKRCQRCSFGVSTLCVVCQNPIDSLSYFCPLCHHGGHILHIISWFRSRPTCPTGCGCSCLF
eukprot:NODE_102_length_19640_cov_1.308735.p3 type:complete len:745 gc:universal NODE_102_length_19640_cov_1.308735:4945-7179(+)